MKTRISCRIAQGREPGYVIFTHYISQKGKLLHLRADGCRGQNQTGIQRSLRFCHQRRPRAALSRKKSPEKILRAKKLDAVPKPLATRQAPFPVMARVENITEGEAIVEFLIGTEGKVRLPRIVSATHPSFGYVAAQTVANWRFEPPKAQGKPAVTRVRLPAGFSLNTQKSPGSDQPAPPHDGKKSPGFCYFAAVLTSVCRDFTD